MTDDAGVLIGIVTLEDLLEALLGMEITDEAEAAKSCGQRSPAHADTEASGFASVGPAKFRHPSSTTRPNREQKPLDER